MFGSPYKSNWIYYFGIGFQTTLWDEIFMRRNFCEFAPNL